MLGTDLLVPHVSDALMDAVNNIELEKPELTCISEEGIADMDLPDNILDEFDLGGDCITSCNKVSFFNIPNNTRRLHRISKFMSIELHDFQELF